VLTQNELQSGVQTFSELEVEVVGS